MAAGAVGAPGTPGPLDIDDEMLVCLLELLGLRRIDPDRAGRVGGGCWTAVRVLAAFCIIPECSTMTLTPRSLSPRMLPWPVGEGNWVSLKSVEADSRLLWRSSKLTEGRKSKDVVVESPMSSDAPFPFLPPNENRE